MQSNIKISYIIVTWNNENIIQECIDSLFKYCNYDNEVIVVDNDSNDKTCGILKSLYGERIKLIEMKVNLGFSKANNIGLKNATGEYVFYVNPDVIFIEDIVTPMLDILDKNNDIGVVSPMLLYKDMSYQVSSCNFPKASKVFWDDCHFYKILSKEKRMKYAQAQYKGNENRYVDWTYGAAHFCRKEDLMKVGGYPEGYFMYGEDTEFCMQFLDKLEMRTYYLGSNKLIHIGGYSEKQVLKSQKIVYGTRAAMYFVNKYYGKSSLIRYRCILFAISFIKGIVYSVRGVFNKSQGIKNNKLKWITSWKTVIKYRGEQN